MDRRNQPPPVPPAQRMAPEASHASAERQGYRIPDEAYARWFFGDKLERASRFIQVPDQATIVHVPGPTPQSNPATLVEFQEDGYIVGFVGDAKNLGTGVARAALAVKLETNGGQTAITSDGNGAVAMPLSLLCPSPSSLGASPPATSALVRRVTTNDKLAVTFSSVSQTTDLTPVGGFRFISCADLEAMGWDPSIPPPAVGTNCPAWTRAYVVPGQPTADVGLAAGITGNNLTVEFKQTGLLVGMRADTVADTAALRAMLALQIQTFGELKAITSNGQGLNFNQATLLCAGAESWFGFVRDCRIWSRMTVTCQNTGGTTIVPAVGFFLRADKDCFAASLTEG